SKCGFSHVSPESSRSNCPSTSSATGKYCKSRICRSGPGFALALFTMSPPSFVLEKGVVKRLYDPLVRDARDRFAGRPAVASLLSPDTNPAALERCLLAFCAYGIAMTDCVESWIRRAADRCVELGLEDVGHALHAHAAHEAGHHLMLIAD